MLGPHKHKQKWSGTQNVKPQKTQKTSLAMTHNALTSL